jgi:AraC family transcriptional regulator, regulatory protein of adaptative response / methylphosphotriester-DNA alkyltransferase methyltransferase
VATGKAKNSRRHEIVQQFIEELDKHMLNLSAGGVNDKHTVQDFADLLHIHPVHFTNVIRAATGRTPCSFYKEKLIVVAKQLLSNPAMSISQVAACLTFDPSNFSKFFKRLTGVTPQQYREIHF